VIAYPIDSAATVTPVVTAVIAFVVVALIVVLLTISIKLLSIVLYRAGRTATIKTSSTTIGTARRRTIARKY
jgi:hypothetical protein